MSQKKTEEKTKNKIASFHDYQNEAENPEMDRFLQESIRKEADDLEARLNSDPSLAGISVSDDMFDKIVGRLKEEGYWEEDEESPEESMQPQVTQEEQQEELLRLIEKGRKAEQQEKENARKKAGRNRLIRRAATIAAVFVILISADFSTGASRGWILKMWDAAMEGFGFKTETDHLENGIEARIKSDEEQKALEEIKDSMNVPVPDFLYMPEQMQFLEYEIIEVEWDNIMYYSYEEKIINLEIVKLEKQGVSYYISDDSMSLLESYNHTLGAKIEIWKMNSDQEITTYIVDIQYEDCRYVLTGMLPLEEIKKMLDYMIFL